MEVIQTTYDTWDDPPRVKWKRGGYFFQFQRGPSDVEAPKNFKAPKKKMFFVKKYITPNLFFLFPRHQLSWRNKETKQIEKNEQQNKSSGFLWIYINQIWFTLPS